MSELNQLLEQMCAKEAKSWTLQGTNIRSFKGPALQAGQEIEVTDAPDLREALKRAVKVLAYYGESIPLGREAREALAEIAGLLKEGAK